MRRWTYRSIYEEMDVPEYLLPLDSIYLEQQLDIPFSSLALFV
jgi:hypothetical protein